MRSKSRLYPENAGVGLDHMSAADKLALAMIPEIEIWRAASLMLKRYGEKALEESAARADELFAEQDHDGAAVLRRIRRSRPARQHEAVWPAPLTTWNLIPQPDRPGRSPLPLAPSIIENRFYREPIAFTVVV
jgi:hypothetical protein